MDYLTKGDAAHTLDVQLDQASLRGDAVYSGCAPSHGTNSMETDVASGTVVVGGTVLSVAAETVTHNAGNTDPRFDVVYVENAAGTANVTISEGTPATAQHAQGDDTVSFSNKPFEFAAPAPDDYNDIVEGAVIAVVAIPAGATDYTAADHLRDQRQFADTDVNALHAEAEALLPQYAETANAPAAQRNLIWTDGSGSDPEAVWVYDGTSYHKVGAGLALADIAINADRDWGANAVTNMSSLQLNQHLVIEQGRGPINLPSMTTNYADGLSSAEVGRWEAQTGEQFEVWLLDVNFKGGGSNTNFTVEIKDEGAATTLASTSDLTAGGTTPLGTSGAGNQITLRVTNSTGAAQDVSIDGQIFRVNA